MPPLERVRFGHGDGSERTQSLTLPSTTPVFATQPLKEKGELSEKVKLRQNKYLNNRIEQDHRFIKWLVKPGRGFKSFNTARRTIKGYETMHMLKKGQVKDVKKGAVRERVKFVAEIFGVAG